MGEILKFIPEPDGLPVPAGWFLLLLGVTYYLHLLAAGTMFGVSAAAVLGHFKGRSDPGWKNLGSRLSKILPFSIALAVNMGVAPLLFLQVLYGNFFYTASILIALPWILLIVFLIAGYYLAYWIIFKKEGTARVKAMLSFLVTVILGWIAFMLVNVNTLMMTPGRWPVKYFSSPAGHNLNLSESTLWPRYVFYLFLFMTIGGTFIALYYRITKDRFQEARLASHFGSMAAGYFGFFSIPLFILFIIRLPGEIKEAFLGGSAVWTAAAVFFVALLLVFGYLSLKGKRSPAAVLLALDLVIFVLIRSHIRYLYLRPFREKLALPASVNQSGVMILFFMILLSGLGLLIWLLVKTARDSRVHT